MSHISMQCVCVPILYNVMCSYRLECERVVQCGSHSLTISYTYHKSDGTGYIFIILLPCHPAS